MVEWFQPTVSKNANSVTHRYSHSACIHDCYMYVFGGCTATNTTFNDLWKFNLGTYEWTRLLTTGTYPSPKAYASMVTWKDNLVLFGGWTHPSVYPLHQQWVLFNELHMYDILANRWMQLYYAGAPPPTAGHTSSVHNDVVVIFGGLQRQDGLSTSTNDIFCLNLMNESWFKPQVSSTKPQPRYGHSQIKLDERHLLVMAGCGGSNKLYSDVWLLTLPEDPASLTQEWTWESIKVEGLENMPSQIWYNPACKVDDHIVILSTWNWQGAKGSSAPGKMHQLFVPGTVRRQSANAWIPPQSFMAEGNQQPEHFHHVNLDVNINGQRGTLRPPLSEAASASSSSDEGIMVTIPHPPPRLRARPSIRPNASSDRERMLQMLSHMEKKIKTRQMAAKASEKKACETKSNPSCILVPHLLDASQVVSCKVVSWLPVALNKDGNPPFIGVSPSPCLLYSLLKGRGHLIMFGGIPNDPSGTQNQGVISNIVNFIAAPSLSLHNCGR